MKVCTRCGVEKPLSQFHGQRGRTARSHCRECHYDKLLLRRYGITLVDFNLMAKKQGYRCLLCREKKRLVVDHDHGSGEVRGLLCVPCNRFLGTVEWRPQILKRIVQYLKGEL